VNVEPAPSALIMQCRREHAEEVITWLEATAGWNAMPMPFVWHGTRWDRRQRPPAPCGRFSCHRA